MSLQPRVHRQRHRTRYSRTVLLSRFTDLSLSNGFRQNDTVRVSLWVRCAVWPCVSPHCIGINLRTRTLWCWQSWRRLPYQCGKLPQRRGPVCVGINCSVCRFHHVIGITSFQAGKPNLNRIRTVRPPCPVVGLHDRKQLADIVGNHSTIPFSFISAWRRSA